MNVGVLREKCQIYKPTLYITYWKFEKEMSRGQTCTLHSHNVMITNSHE